MKKMVYAAVFFLGLAHINAQDYSPKQQQRMDYLGLDYNYLIEQSEANEKQLREILDMDRKRKNNLIMGASFAGLGLLFLTTGASILGQDSDCNDTQLCENPGQVIVGGGLMMLGTIEVGVSLPLFISSLKRKKLRNKMIRELHAQYPEIPQ
ncbi:MAG: hypothetical protein RIM83_13225 [Allomuricauda sp.]